MTRTFTASITVLGLFVALSACKTEGADGDDGGITAQPIPEEELPEAEAQALCELFFECSCESDAYPDEATCVETRRSTFSDDQAAAQAAGLSYDAQCAGDALALAQSTLCAPYVALDCDSYCAPYHGDLGVGMPCSMPVETQPTWSDCAQGLWCLAGSCQDPCGGSGLLGLGDACRDEMGQSLGQCDTNLWCDFETSSCIALPGAGEPCYGGEICAPGAVCDYSSGDGLCVAAPGEGEACTYVCDVGFYCNGVDGAEGTCVGLPSAGQPCWQGACAAGLLCNDADVCEEPPAWVCSTGQ